MSKHIMSKHINIDPDELYLIELHLRRLRLMQGQRSSEARDLRRALATELGRTNRAIRRVELGGYGHCECCDRPLDREQLRRNPALAVCHRCQANLERQIHRPVKAA